MTTTTYKICNNFPIHRAAESGLLYKLTTLLKNEPGLVNQWDSSNRSPLHIVTQSICDDNYETSITAIEILLEFNSDINLNTSPTLDTPLNILVRRLSEITSVDKQRKILDFISEKVLLIDLSLLEDEVLDILGMTWNPDDYNELSIDETMRKLKQLMKEDEKQMIRTLYTLSKQPKFKEVIKNSIEINHLLGAAIDNDLVLSVQMIIEVGKKFVIEHTLYRAIRRSCVFYHPVILEEILDIWIKFFGRGTYRECGMLTNMIRWRKGAVDRAKLYGLMLRHPSIDVNQVDSFGASVLYIAIIFDDSVLIEKLLSKNVFIGSLSHENTCMPMDIIDHVLLEEYFDSCIQKVHSKYLYLNDLCFRMEFNYTCFKPPAEHRGRINELAAIEHIAANKKLQHLIQHPLITSFLLLKWHPLRWFFYANLIFYAINFIMLTGYMWWCYGQNNTFEWIPLFFAISIAIRELVQIAIAPTHYFSSISNFIELMLIGLSSLTYCDRMCFELDSNRRAVGALVILFATIELMLLLGTIPNFSLSLYVSMLRKVTTTFLHALVVYAVILIAFATSFFTLFGYYGDQKLDNATNSDDGLKITNPAFAALKTIVMFTGEFEASNLNFEFSNWVGYIIFVIFVFLVAIIMMNLLSGLAVSDTQQIIADATLYDWIERVKLLSRFEEIMLTNKLLANLIPHKLKSNILEVEINNSIKCAKITNFYVKSRQSDSLDSVVDLDFRALEKKTGHNLKKKTIWTRAKQTCRWFLGNKMTFDFDIAKKSMQLLEKCSNQKQEEQKQKNEKDDMKKRLEEVEEKLNEMLLLLKNLKGQEL